MLEVRAKVQQGEIVRTLDRLRAVMTYGASGSVRQASTQSRRRLL